MVTLQSIARHTSNSFTTKISASFFDPLKAKVLSDAHAAADLERLKNAKTKHAEFWAKILTDEKIKQLDEIDRNDLKERFVRYQKQEILDFDRELEGALLADGSSILSKEEWKSYKVLSDEFDSAYEAASKAMAKVFEAAGYEVGGPWSLCPKVTAEMRKKFDAGKFSPGVEGEDPYDFILTTLTDAAREAWAPSFAVFKDRIK